MKKANHPSRVSMKIRLAMLAAAICLQTPLSWSADADAKTKTAKDKPEITAEQRAKMAEAHEKMAACLRSDKSMDACHDEMKTYCHEGDSMCPMMGMHHGMGMGMGMGKKMGKAHHDKMDGNKESEGDKK
jgi:hypothetical protein